MREEEEFVLIPDTKVEEINFLQNYFLVKPDTRKEATDSGIIMLNGQKATRNADGGVLWGTIIKVSPEVESLKAGYRVPLDGAYFGVEIDKENYFIMSEGQPKSGVKFYKEK